MKGHARPEQADREREQGTHDGRHDRSPLTEDGNIDISEAARLLQIVGKINRDAEYEYSGRTAGHLALHPTHAGIAKAGMVSLACEMRLGLRPLAHSHQGCDGAADSARRPT